jgi:diadenosine tetraphosphatase ApaH/serine/threonine PP2A family protein phosphatase
MRLAVLTDIHGNREAFSAVLADLAQRKVDRIAILGDIVGYGPDPSWCCEKVIGLAEEGALVVKGNHDHAIGDPSEMMTANAKTAIDWTRQRLDAVQREFLARLPLTETQDDLMFVHASANDPGDWIYVTSEHKAMPSFRVCGARVIFCGHVHVPALMSSDLSGLVRQQRIPMGMPVPLIRSRRWLAVVGSVGQPRDGVPQAGYAVFDTAGNELTFRRVPYDTAATAARVRAAGLPETLARRLERGE